MWWIWSFFIPLAYGVSSQQFYEYQRSEIRANWVRVEDEGGPLNVTVDFDYEGYDQIAHWWVNGKVITDGEFNFRVSYLSVYRDMASTDTAWNGAHVYDENIKRASILIPPNFSVQSLHLQLVSVSQDLRIHINVPATPRKRVMLEYIDKYELEMDKKDEIRYNPGDDLTFRATFETKGLSDMTFHEPETVFLSMDQCVTPVKATVKTSKRNDDFLSIFEPETLLWSEYSSDNKRIRRWQVIYDSEHPPRGVVKIETGYTSPFQCRLLKGLTLVQAVFLKPTPHQDHVFFNGNPLAFTNLKSRHHVETGETLDVTIGAFGGFVNQTIYYHDKEIVEPNVKLLKKGEVIEPFAQISTLLETEAHFRFRHIDRSQAGRYTVAASLNGTTIKKDFVIYVLDANPSCSEI